MFLEFPANLMIRIDRGGGGVPREPSPFLIPGDLVRTILVWTILVWTIPVWTILIRMILGLDDLRLNKPTASNSL